MITTPYLAHNPVSEHELFFSVSLTDSTQVTPSEHVKTESPSVLVQIACINIPYRGAASESPSLLELSETEELETGTSVNELELESGASLEFVGEELLSQAFQKKPSKSY